MFIMKDYLMRIPQSDPHIMPLYLFLIPIGQLSKENF